MVCSSQSAAPPPKVPTPGVSTSSAISASAPGLRIHPAALPPVGHQPRVLQDLKVEQQPVLSRLECIGQVTDAPLPEPEPLQDREPGLVGEGVEQPRGASGVGVVRAGMDQRYQRKLIRQGRVSDRRLPSRLTAWCSPAAPPDALAGARRATI